ncbi:helix-turn-helix domain-containing protein [Clostridium saccharoperbutylacetonicum]
MEITKLKKKIFFSFFALQFTGIAIYYLFNTHYIFRFILHSSIVLVIMYELYVGLKNYNQVVNKDLKQAIKALIFITMIFLPFIILESYKPYIQLIKNIELFKISALPSYFLIINIFNIIFALKYFNTPIFMDNNKLTDYFKQKYNITEKQTEIIELIIQGLTYKEIATKLFISPKTVDNHVQNIYQKLNVNSKMQLSHFVHSNSK